MKKRRHSPLVGFALLAMTLTATAAPTIDPTEDKAHFGPIAKLLFWTPEQQVAGYRNIDRLSPVRRMAAGDRPLPLRERAQDLSAVVVRNGQGQMTVAEYLERQSVAGLLVVKNGAIVYERYLLGNNRDSRWISFSVAKSVTSMLVGAAIQDGYIKSVDEKVTDYLPRLKGSAYDQVSIRDILRMSSGVGWDETYDNPASDVNRAPRGTLALYDYLRQKPRNHAPGAVFNYNSAETNLVGTLLRAAVGNNLATYLEEKIWRPFGMESDAYWRLSEPGGGESGGCCISATLRDYARLGLFALNEGRLADGTRVLPEGWMAESTKPWVSNPGHGYFGYGYLWWLNDDGSYQAIGIFGQGIFIDPAERLVIALHSARPNADRDEDWALQNALYFAIASALKDRAQ